VNTVNRIAGRVMDVILRPFEFFGPEVALILVSGIFGIVALLIFKRVSWQEGIKRTKDQIKADMIAIRLYQDDLGIVAGSVGKIVLRNTKYLCLNFMPILPLLPPFVLVLAQLVVRYGYDPLPVQGSEALASELPGTGTMVKIRFKKGEHESAQHLSVSYPDGIQTMGPLVRSAFDGVAFQEIAATAPVDGKIEMKIDGKLVGSKEIVAGERRPKMMQPTRTASSWLAWLWPAEPTFDEASPIQSIDFEYPNRNLHWLPGGSEGILIVFFVASLLFGVAILKPLNIQI